MNKERLLNVAKACRESRNPDQFSMARYVNTCGTPACAFGHYAARADLQDEFSINTEQNPKRWNDEGVHDKKTGEQIWYDSDEVLAHFDATEEELKVLFNTRGCGGARTPEQAAEYIERFVAEHS